MKYYLGIDGGGTKTEFLLTDENRNVISCIAKTGSNPNDIGMEKCVDILLEGIDDITKNIDKNSLYIFAGVAGLATGNNAKILRENLSKKYPNVEVASDVVNALEICLHGQDGLAVICGTGISAVICKGQKYKIVGGYGHLFEDGGSGYSYGRDAVKVALRYEDGCGEKTVLYDYLCERLGGGVRAHLREILTKGKFYVASFCPLVFKGYNVGDSVCKEIIMENLEATVAMVKDALFVSGQVLPKIAFMGGVSKEVLFREYLTKVFGAHAVSFCDEKPVWGAVYRAMKGEEKC